MQLLVNLRIYYEAFHAGISGKSYKELISYVPRVKLGIAHLPSGEVTSPGILFLLNNRAQSSSPRARNDRNFFAAWEVPDSIIQDLRAMFSKNGPCYGIISGKDGY
jgi:hypothetical protein